MTRGSELPSAPPPPSLQHLLPATDAFGGPPSLSLPGTRSAGLLYHAVPDTPVTNADILRQAFPSNHPKSDRLQCGDLSSSRGPQPHPCPSEDAGQLDGSSGRSLAPSGSAMQQQMTPCGPGHPALGPAFAMSQMCLQAAGQVSKGVMKAVLFPSSCPLSPHFWCSESWQIPGQPFPF